jgi:hypothetical protein
MSTDTKISDEQIVSYVDGELDEHEIAKIKAALQDNPSLQIKVDDYKKSESILKTGFSIDGLKTPDHILARLDVIEKAAEKSTKTKIKTSFLENIYSYIQLQIAIPTTAAFALGILLAPSLLPLSGGITLKGGDAIDNQIATRGSLAEGESVVFDMIAINDSSTINISDYLNARIIQNGNGITNGGIIQAGVPFSVSLLSPFNGAATIRELTEDIQSESLDTVNIAAGRYLTFAAMQADDQSSLTLSIELNNNEIQVTQILEFDVQK